MADSVRTKTLLILIRAENLANAQMMEAATQAEVAGARISKAFKGIQLGLGVAGLAAAGFLVESVKAASDFNSMLVKTLNNTTMTAAQMQQIGAAILKMSAATGAPLQDLANGMMHISDVGFSVADSITVMQQALESAMSTGANVGEVAQVLSATMHEFGGSAKDAAKYMDVLHLASAEGNSTLEQFVETSGKAFAMAANLNVPLTDVAASLAALSRHGIGAAQASTMISGALSKIINPAVGTSALLAKITKETGIDLTYAFSTAGLKALGLQGVMEKLGQAAAKSSTDVMKLIPATRGGLAALILTGRGASDYTTILNQLNDAMAGKLTPTAVAFMLQQQTTASAVDRLTASFHVMMIEVGQQLIPALNTLLARVAPFVTVLGVWVTTHAKLATEILVVVSALGLLSGGMALLEVVLGPLAGVIAAVGAPLLAIAAAAGVLYEAWTHDWGGIQEKTQAVWSAVKPVFSAMGEAVASLRAAFNAGGLGAVFSGLPGALGGVGSAVSGVAGSVAAQFAGAFSQINWPDVEANVIHGLNDVFNTLTSWLQQNGIPFFTGRLKDIGTAFKNIDWKKIGQDILNALGKIKDDILAIDWKNVGKNILGALDALRKDIAAADWAGLWKNLKAAFLGVIGWIRSLNWGGWADDAIKGIQTALSTIGGWITAAGHSTLAKDLEEWAKAFGAWVPGAVQAFLKAWPSMLSSFLDKIADAAGPILLQLALWGVQFAKWVAPAIPGLVKALVGFTVALTVFILETAVTIGNELIKWGVKFVEWVAPYVPGMLKELGKLAGSLISWIGGETGQLGNALHKWASEFGTWVMNSAWPNMQSSLGTLFGNLGSWIGNESGALGTDLGKWASEFGKWVIAKGWPELQKGLTNLGDNLGTWIVQTSPPAISAHLGIWALKFHEWAITKAWPQLLSGAKTLLDNFTAWIKGGAGDAILDAAKTWPLKIVSGLLSANKDILVATGKVLLVITGAFVGANVALFAGGVDFIKGLIKGLLSQTGALLHTIDSAIGTDLKDPFNKASTWLYNAGAQIIGGLIDGIKSKVGDLVGELGKITSLIPSHKGPPSVDKLLLHNSGQMIMQGLIDGLKSKEGALGAYLTNVTDAIKNGVSGKATMKVAVAAAASYTGANGGNAVVPVSSSASGNGIGTQTNHITVHINGTSVSTSGDQTGMGAAVSKAIIGALRTFRQSSQASNSTSGRLALGGAI